MSQETVYFWQKEETAMGEKRKILFQIFISTLYLSAFTFGGGYVIVTLMKKKFVDQYHWIEEKEMLDLIAIAESAPGAIAVNGAVVVGYKLAGAAGVVTAVVATILPPFVILSLISVFYDVFRENVLINQMLTGMQAGVGAVIASVTYDMAVGVVQEKRISSIIIMGVSFAAASFFGVNVIYVILACLALGIFQTIINKGIHKNGHPTRMDERRAGL